MIDTLEAALWSLLTTSSYRECVLAAVNLGEDTDTVGAVAGSLAGIWYGMEQIPKEWIEEIARKEWIFDLCEKFEKSLNLEGNKNECRGNEKTNERGKTVFSLKKKALQKNKKSVWSYCMTII